MNYLNLLIVNLEQQSYLSSDRSTETNLRIRKLSDISTETTDEMRESSGISSQKAARIQEPSPSEVIVDLFERYANICLDKEAIDAILFLQNRHSLSNIPEEMVLWFTGSRSLVNGGEGYTGEEITLSCAKQLAISKKKELFPDVPGIYTQSEGGKGCCSVLIKCGDAGYLYMNGRLNKENGREAHYFTKEEVMRSVEITIS